MGIEAATALAAAFLVDTVAAARRVPGATVVLAATARPSAYGPVEGVAWVQQGGGDLGERLERVLRARLHTAPWAIAIGGDSPGMDPDQLVTAAHVAAGGRAALAPSVDGGFTLLALPRCPEGLLQDLPWSQATTGERTWRRLVEAGLDPVRLEAWFDVDVPDDLARFRRRVPRLRAPATWAALDAFAPER